MKTLNFELSKRLNDLWLLDNIETEYWIEYDNENQNNDITYYLPFNKNIICKTLTLEEAIEFLPNSILYKENKYYCLNIFRNLHWEYLLDYSFSGIVLHSEEEEILLEAVEKMLEYLLNNNLLTKNKDVQ